MTRDSLQPPTTDLSLRARAVRLLEELRHDRVEVLADGDRLRLKAPRGTVTSEQRRALGDLKPQLIELLGSEGPTPSSPPRSAGSRVSPKAQDLPAAPRSTLEGGPLPAIEEGLWFLSRLAPDDPAYNVALVAEIEGPIERDLLVSAVEQLIDRQPILGVRFEPTREGPRWNLDRRLTLDRRPPLALEAISGRGWTPDRRRVWVDGFLERPFDLEAGPVFRAAWLDSGDGRHLLLLVWHHLVGDARSAALLLRDLERGLGSSAQATTAVARQAVPPFSRQTSPRQKEDLSWWRDRLTPLPPRLDLPADHRRGVETPRGDCLARPLDPQLVTALRSLARRFDATLFMVGAAIVQLHLARLSGLTRIALATPVDQRDSRTADTVGLFVNPVVLDIDLAGAESFGTLLRRARRAALEAFDRASVPLGELVRVLAPPRSGSRQPLVSVMFNVADVSGIRLEVPGCTSRVSLVEPGARYDLTIYLLLDGPDTRLEIAWNRDLYDRPRIEAMLRQLEHLMEQVTGPAGTERPLHHFRLDPAVPGPSLTTPASPHDERPAHHRVLTWGQRDDLRPAIEDDGGTRSYGWLVSTARDLASILRRSGVAPGQVVVVEGGRNAAFVASSLGVFEAGAALAVLDPSLPVERLARAVERWSPVAWVGSGSDPADDTVAELARRFPEIARLDLPAGEAPGGELGEGTKVWPRPALGGSALAWVPCTSGTTGEPRVVATPHGPIARFLDWALEAFDLDRHDRFALLAGLGHDPLLRDLLLPLSLGSTLVCPPPGLRRDGAALADWLARDRITAVHLTPALAELLTQSRRSLPRLRSIVLGGDRLSHRTAVALRAMAPEARLSNVYGTTETPQVVAWHPITAADLDPRAPRTLPVGRGIPGVALQVIGPDGIEPAGLGELGEVMVAGEQLAWGLLGDPATTAEHFVPDPTSGLGARRYRTGDLGRRGLGGVVTLAGRRDRQIQVRGSRVEPGEIEALLLADPSVSAAAVGQLPPPNGHTSETGDPLTAWVVPRNGAAPDDLGERLRAHLRQHLPEPLVPSRIVGAEALPLTPNGKIDFAALAAETWSAETGSFEPPEETPPTPRELAMATLWREVLGVRSVPRHASFFELGGHSLLVPRLLDRVRDLFGNAPRLATFFQRPTVAGLVAAIEAGMAEDRAIEAGGTEQGRNGGPRSGTAIVRRAPEAWRPSAAQRRLWFLHRLDPTSPAYHLARALDLRGPLDRTALEAALVDLVTRQQSLRTGWVDHGGEPRPVLRSIEAPLLARIDLSALGQSRKQREITRRLDREARRPFDLEHGLSIRTTLLVLGPEHHVLFLTLHHLAADAASIGILARELSVLYRARSGGHPSPLAPLPHQVGDVTTALHATTEKDHHADDLAWWRSRLADAPVLELPFARPASARRLGAVRRRPLPEALAAGLEAATRQQGTTPFVVLLSAWKLLLARLGGAWDVVVGTAVQNRPRSAEALIGLFLDTLPLRTTLSPEQSFTQLVQEVHQGLLESLVHQQIGFARLVEALAPRRDLANTPFFQTFFNLVDVREHQFELAGIKVEALPRREDLTVKLDLGLHAVQTRTGLELLLIFDARRIEPDFGESLLHQLELLLVQALDTPERPLVAFDLLGQDPHQALDAPAPTTTVVDYPSPIESIARWVARAPAVPALRFVEADALLPTTRTYGELGTAVERLAAALTSAGVSAGDRVAIQGRREASVVVALLSVWRVGGVALLVDRDLPQARRRWMIERARPEFLVDWAPDRTEWHRLTADRVLVPDPDQLFETGPDSSPKPFERGSPRSTGNPHAYIVFTSGSSGEPKRLVGSQRALGHFFAWQRTTFGIGPGDRVALLATLSFDAVLRDMLLPLTSGATLSIPPAGISVAAPELGHWMAEEKITVAHRVPSLAQAQLAAGEPTPLPDLRWLFLVGEPLREGLVRALQRSTNATVVNLYGPTETTLIKCFHPVDPLGPEREGGSSAAVPVGRPLPETRIRVLGADSRPCGVGETGEIWIETPHRTLGTLPDPSDPFRRPAATGSESAPDTAYPTGDLGYWRPDGTLVVVGRRDDQLKIRGVRIEPGEVEAVLDRLSEVEQSVVVGHRPEAVAEGRGAECPDAGAPEAGARLVAFVIPASGRGLDPGALRRELRSRLPEALVPTVFVPLDSLPRTATGKIDRRSLANRPLPEPQGDAVNGADFLPPRAGPESELAEAWRSVLGVDRAIGRDDDFFALGGHSLLATRLLAQLRATPGPLGRGASHPEALRTLFEAPNLAEQTNALVNADASLANQDGVATAGPPELADRSFPRAEGEEHPLSFHQRRLWFLERFEEGPGAYQVTRSLPLRGRLDPAGLEAALATLAQRHAILRTALVERGDEVVQCPRDTPGPWLHRVDLSGLPVGRRQLQRRRRIAAEARHPFDLSAGRLMRATLLDLGPNSEEENAPRSWELVLVFHHLAIDAPSLEIFAHELSMLYDALRGLRGGVRRASPLAPLRHSYTDYAVWQRQRFDESSSEPLVEVWRQRLAGADSLELPTDRPRPSHGAHRGAQYPVPLGRVAVEGLEALGRRHRASLFMVLAALFQALLQRLAGQADVSLGTPINQRPHPDLEPVMGFFANTLVLRGRRSGDPSFGDWLDQVREICLDAYAHQDLPFEVLVRALDPERDPGRNPLFQALLALHQRPAAPLGLPGLESAPVEAWGSVARFDLQWVVVVDGPELRSRFEYSADLFDATTVQRWAAALGRLARAALEDPGRPLSALPWLGRGERHQLLHGWNDTRSDLGSDTDLATRIREQIEQTPEAVAVEAEGVPLTYGELGRRANQLSHLLLSLGLDGGSVREFRVAAAIERSHELLIALVGILGAGAAYIPLDRSYPEARLRRIFEEARPRCLVTAGPLPFPTDVTHIDLVADAAALERLPTTPPVRRIDPLDLVYGIFTSGSTGRPKGVLCSHRAVVNRLLWMQRRFPIGPEDRVLQKTPVGFDVSVWELFWPLLVGARVVMARPEGHKDTGYLRQVITERRITTLHFVPSMLRAFLDQGGLDEGGLGEKEGEPRLASLRRVFASGEALPRDPANRFLAASDAELHNLYGPTEAAVDVTWEPIRDRHGAVSLGRPIDNLRLAVVDANLRLQPVGVVGELVLGGVGLARGYLHRPGLTAESFVPDPLSGSLGERLYRTGDRVRQRPDGRLDFLGRLDHQVKLRGFRIELGDIESHLADHPQVGQAVVALDGDRLVAWCVAPADSGTTPEALRNHLVDRLPEPMVPTAIVVLEDLPLLPNGKVDRKRLPAPTQSRSNQRRLAEPESPLEKLLAEIWTEVLDRPVGRDDNFFELGGDSILALRIVARARPRGLELVPRDLFDHQTLADLAHWVVLDGRQRAPETPTQHGPVVGPAPWTPIQHHFFDHLAERGLEHPEHFNWARMWRVSLPLDPRRLRRIAGLVEGHHDALRSCFPTEERSAGRLQILAPREPPATWIDLSRLAPGRARSALEEVAAQAQTSLDLESGPLWRLLGFGLPGVDPAGQPLDLGDSRLLLIAHHLVVDAVSWSVLAEDLATLVQGGEPLPTRTASIESWTTALLEAAYDPRLPDTLERWQGLPSTPEARRDGPPNAETASPRPAGEARRPRRLRREFEADLGRRLRELTHRHRLRIDDVLLTALALAQADDRVPWLAFDVEGHGREALRHGLDASRTVGWLTALYPVVVDLPSAAVEVGALLRSIKETLRTVPGGGVPFGVLEYLTDGRADRRTIDLPPRPILFNYLGAGPETSSPGDTAGPLTVADESPGPTRGPHVGPSHPLELVAGLRGEVLRLEASWWPDRWRGAEVPDLVEGLVTQLDGVLSWLEGPSASCLTPSDFPLARLDAPTLEHHFGPVGGDRQPIERRTNEDTPNEARTIEDLYPTSATQEAILYYHLYHPSSTAYFDHTSFLLDGPVDPERVRRAGQRLLDQHAILRTTVRWQGLDEPLQVVWREATLPFEVLDWSEVDSRRHEAHLRQFIEQDRRRGYDLSQPPLLRWTLIRLAPKRFRLVWSYHHLVLDGWSLPLLLHDFYRAYREPGAPLPATRPFRDYIRWLALHDRERAAPFWRRALRGFTEATPLPFDRPPRDSATGPVVRGRSHSLDEATSEAVTALARRARVTLNTVVQAAWALVLNRYSGEREVLFGATLAGRPPEVRGIESMIGLFVNTLPVRVGTAPDQDIGTWLAELQKWNLEMRGVDDSRLFDLHRWSAVPPGRPLFESALLFQSYPRHDGPVLADLGIVSHGFRAFGHTSYPLTLTAKPRRRLLLQLAWDTLRFDATTAQRMLATLVHTLEELGRCGSHRLGDLRRLRPSEEHQLLREINDRPALRPDGRLEPIAALRRRARDNPEAAAVVHEGEVVLSYGELARRMERLARLLEHAGIGPEVPVGVFVTRSPEMVVAVLAVLATGAAYVPLDPLHPPRRLAWILEEMGIRWVLTQRKLVGDLPSTGARPLPIDGLGSINHDTAEEELSALGGRLGIQDPLAVQDRLGVQDRPGTQDPLGTHEAFPGPGTPPPEPWLDESLAYVLYTSGSTGRPKAVGIRRRALANYCRLAARRFGLKPGRRMLQFASLGFDTSVEEIFPTLASGATLVLRNERMLETPATFLATVDSWGIDVLDLPTAYWHQLCAELGASYELPTRLRTVILGGEAILPARLARWQALARTPRLFNTYGPTEATIVAGDCELSEPRRSLGDPRGASDASEATTPESAVSIGRPIPSTHWVLVDRGLRAVPQGAPGELCLGGDQLARGYLHRPGLTAQQFVPDPWSGTPGARLYRTGDRARARGDGELLFLGRIDHQVKVRGLRIELGEVEVILGAHPRVEEAVVSVVDSKGARARLVAHVVPSQDAQDQDGDDQDGNDLGGPDGSDPRSETLDLDDLRSFAKSHLPFYMLPSDILVVPTLPRTPTGKIDRRQLLASIPHKIDSSSAKAREQTSDEAPRDATERALAELFAEVLGFEDPSGASLGREDEYFDLGGDSLLAVRLMARVERRFGVPLTLAELFSDFTVVGLARRLAVASCSDDPHRADSHPAASHIATSQTADSKAADSTTEVEPLMPTTEPSRKVSR